MRSTGRVARLARILLGVAVAFGGSHAVMAQSASPSSMTQPRLPKGPPVQMGKRNNPPPPPSFGGGKGVGFGSAGPTSDPGVCAYPGPGGLSGGELPGPASGDTSGYTMNHSGGDTQDGGVCPPLHPGVSTDTSVVGGDSALIGPAPFDLRAMLQGEIAPVAMVANPAAEMNGYLLSGVLGDRPNYGTSFAFGGFGTVGVRSGAFVHPFTILSLPCDVPSMGVAIAITYRSDAIAPSTPTGEPFGPGFTMSGLDLLEITEWQGTPPDLEPHTVKVWRGDGLSTNYVDLYEDGTLDPPQGAQDELVWDGTLQEFTRYLHDGRAVRYERTTTTAGVYFFHRKSVENLLAKSVAGERPSIHYHYDPNSSLDVPPLASIVDTRGIQLDFTWETLAAGQRITKIRINESSLLGSLHPPLSPNEPELETIFSYDTQGRLATVQYPPMEIVRDVNADGKIDLASPSELPVVRRPTIMLGYQPDGFGFLDSVIDATEPSALETRLTVGYLFDQVSYVIEGALSITNPTHLFEFVNGDTVYTDPRLTKTTISFEGSDRVESVTMVADPNDPAAKPRTAEGAPFGDHASLTWEIEYDPTCACSLPWKITTPEGILYQTEWEGDGLLKKVTVTPKTGSGLSPRTYSLGYTTHYDGMTPAHIISRDLASYADPLSNPNDNATWWHWYPTYENGWLKSIIRTTPAYNNADGSGQTSIYTEHRFGDRGQVTSIFDGLGVETRFEYYDALESGRYFLKKIRRDVAQADVRTVYTTDDLGRLHFWEEGEGSGRIVEFDSDIYFHPVVQQSPPAGGGVKLVTVRRYDRRGNLTVLELPNRNENGVARSRPTIEHQWVHDLWDRVATQRLDQARLDAATADVLVTKYFYYNNHQLQYEQLPDNSVTEHVIDGYGFLYKTRYDTATIAFTPRSFFFDKDGKLVHVVQTKTGATPVVAITDIYRNGFGEIDIVEDPEQGQVDIDYDNCGRVTHVVGQKNDGTTITPLTHTEWSYNSIGEITHRKRHVLETAAIDDAKFYYNRRSQLTQVVLPYQRGAEIEYDSVGRVLRIRDSIDVSPAGPGNTTEYEYELATGRLHKIRRTDIAAGADDFSVPPASPTPKVQETELVYDLLDQVTQSTVLPEQGSGGSSVVHVSKYDSLGNRVSWQDANQARIDSMFDAFGRSRSRTEIGVGGNPANAVETTVSYIWNPTEHRVERKDGMATPRVTNYIYDKAGRLWKEQHPGYVSGSARNERVFTYDSIGRVEYVTNGNSQVIQQYFDKANRLTGRTYNNWVAPPANEPWVSASDMALAEAFTYDALGRMETAETLANQSASVVKVTTTWDSLSRKTSETFRYFGGTSQGGPADRTVTSGYAFGSSDDYLYRRSLGYPSGYSVAITPDGVGKLQQLDLDPPDPDPQNPTPSVLLAQYRYAGNRPLEREMKLGAFSWQHQDTFFRYDGQRRMDQMKVEAGTSGGPMQEYWRWDFGMGGEGHLQTEKYYELGIYDDDGSEWHSLTNYYGLAGTKIGVPEADFNGSYENAGFDAQYSFTYDTGHNRSVDSVDNGSEFFTTSYTVQPSSHRYAAVDGQEYFYDGEGNLRFDGRFRYRYDFKNRLSQVYLYVPPESGGSSMAMTSGSGLNKGKTTYLVDSEELERLDEAAEKAWPALQSVLSAAQASKAKGGGALSVTSGTAGDGSYEPIAVYGYDAFNRRVFRYLVGEGERYYYAYDGWREIEETLQIGAGSVQEERLFVWGAGLDELVMSGHKVNGVWNHYFVHQDRMGSLHHVSSSMTFVAGETWSYGPYGDVVGAPQAPPDVPPYMWAGRRVDPETQLYYFRNRYYSPGLGRFLTEDPLGVWEDKAHYGNPYSYAGNTPLCLSDPFGLQVEIAIAIGVGVGEAAAGAAAAVSAAVAAVPLAVGVTAFIVAGVLVSSHPARPEVDYPPPDPEVEAARNRFRSISCLGGYPLPTTHFVNKVQPLPNAGPHTGFKRDPETGKITGYTEFDAAGNAIRRFRGTGKPHGGVDPPLILEPAPGKGPGAPLNRARPAEPGEIPK
jgi:RHS repeat-associated protein